MSHSVNKQYSVHSSSTAVGYNRLLYSYFLTSSHPENTHTTVKTATSKPMASTRLVSASVSISFPMSTEYMHPITAPTSRDDLNAKHTRSRGRQVSHS